MLKVCLVAHGRKCLCGSRGVVGPARISANMLGVGVTAVNTADDWLSLAHWAYCGRTVGGQSHRERDREREERGPTFRSRSRAVRGRGSHHNPLVGYALMHGKRDDGGSRTPILGPIRPPQARQRPPNRPRPPTY